MRKSASVALAIGLVLAVFAPPRPAVVGRLAAAVGLPQDRLHFGLANDPDQLNWMTSSGVPWRYRYQYLSAGVNTGSGWETWNSPAGSFATYYMANSDANGYIPVFTYYELLQSSPSIGSNESDRDYNNLNNAATMNAYYANFKLLMQKAGAFGKPVVVHVEPDFWGYMQQRAAGGDASTVSAMVASSGFVDVAGLPDTVQGFGEALVKLRDSNAPNVILGIHASMWSSGIDVASDTSSSVNAGAEADKTAAFLNSAGSWDLVFNDVDDHDAGWWEAQGADNQYFTHWWDPTNRVFPNFSRYIAWVAELKAKTAKPQVVWQVPVGNQYFLTMNNTCGHYQDNVAQYFIAHASDLFAAGLIAVLFGAGNGCQTSYTDVESDGVTNNGGTPTSDVAGYCNACNTHTSVWPDDDGGYLRIFVGLYYENAISIGGVATSDPDVASWAAGRLDVFVRGADNALWHRAWNGTSWLAWESLGGALASAPAAVSATANRIDVFVRGLDGALWTRSWNGTTWTAWQSLGGVLTSGPGVAGSGSSRLDVFARGGDNALWHRTWNGSTWLAWESLGGGITSDPAAVWAGSALLDVAARGGDNAVWHRTWNGTAWSGWQSIGGAVVSAPAASSCTAGALDVFAVGVDDRLWRKSFTTAGWSGWSAAGGQWTSGPGAACQPGTTSIDIVERGLDASVWRVEMS